MALLAELPSPHGDLEGNTQTDRSTRRKATVLTSVTRLDRKYETLAETKDNGYATAISVNGTSVLSRIRRCNMVLMSTFRIIPVPAQRELCCTMEIQRLRSRPDIPDEHIEDRIKRSCRVYGKASR